MHPFSTPEHIRKPNGFLMHWVKGSLYVDIISAVKKCPRCKRFLERMMCALKT